MGTAKLQWPVTPRPGQAEVAERIAQLVESDKRVIFSAPTGWGKTHCVLAALLSAKATPATWMVRSLALSDRVAEDAALWGVRVFVAAGRERTCPLAEERGDAIHDFCRYFKHKCPFAKLPPSPPLAADWRELVARGKEGGWCPYFAQELVDADIFVQNYFRRMRPAKAFVVDEAHNLLLPDERELKLSQLVEAVAALREQGASERLLQRLNKLLHYALVRDGDLDVHLFLDEEDVNEIRYIYLVMIEEGDRRVKPLLDLAKSAAVYVESEKIHTFRPSFLHPFRPAIFVSATLPPEASTFLQAEVEVRVPWTVKPRAEIAQDVTTKFEEYDSKMASRYKKLLIDVAKQQKRVLVFAASERVARDLRAWATYEECIPPEGWEGILLLRARGRFSEGVDLEADAVVIAGAPFLPPPVSDRLARAYKAAGHPDPVKAAIDVPMLTATLQCVGRAWRAPERPPRVLLADQRYEKYANVLENYLALR